MNTFNKNFQYLLSIIFILCFYFQTQATDDPVLDQVYKETQVEFEKLIVANNYYLKNEQFSQVKFYFGENSIKRNTAQFDNPLLDQINQILLNVYQQTGIITYVHFIYTYDYDCNNQAIQPVNGNSTSITNTNNSYAYYFIILRVSD